MNRSMAAAGGGGHIFHLWWCWWMLQFLGSCPIFIMAITPPSSSSSYAATIPSTRSNNNNNINNNNDNDDSSMGFLQVVETEVWDVSANLWKAAGASSSSSSSSSGDDTQATTTTITSTTAGPASASSQVGRWTDEQGRTCLSPSELQPPKGFIFQGDWKIVVQTGRDTLGWEYQFRYLQPPKRRRIWLRSLQQQNLPSDKTTTTSSSSVSTTSSSSSSSSTASLLLQRARNKQRQLQQRRSKLSKLLQLVRDDYNFKGFGVSLYKSFLSLENFGFYLFCPLTMNFDWWDRHPELPSLSTSTMFWYPWCIGQFLSFSVNLEWVKWIFTKTLYTLRRFVWYTIGYQCILRSIVFLGGLWLYPFVGKLYTLPPYPSSSSQQKLKSSASLLLAKPNYNNEISERIGCSASYRWSLKRGFEFRVSCWHSYQPTLTVYQNILGLHRLPSWIPGSSSSSSSSHRKKNRNRNYNHNQQSSSSSNSGGGEAGGDIGWWRSHFARIGTSTAIPMPDPPHISCSGVLALTGFYFRSPTSTNKPTTTTTTDDRFPQDDDSRSSSNTNNNRNDIVDGKTKTRTSSKSELGTSTENDNEEEVMKEEESRSYSLAAASSSSSSSPSNRSTTTAKSLSI